MFPNPIKREERQKAFLRAADKAKAERELHEMGKGSEYPLTPKLLEILKRREEESKVAAKHAEEFAKGTTSAEEFKKWRENLKTLKLKAEKSRLRAVEEENKKFKLKSDATNIVANKLKKMRAAYNKGNDQVANNIAMRLHQNEIERVSDWPVNVQSAAVKDSIKAQVAPTLIPPYKGVFGENLKVACNSHFALRMVHLQQLVGRTAGHVEITTETIRKLHAKHLEELTMLVATVRAQDAAVKQLEEAEVLFKNNPDATGLARARVMAAKEALKTAGIDVSSVLTLNEDGDVVTSLANSLESECWKAIHSKGRVAESFTEAAQCSCRGTPKTLPSST